MKNIVGVSEIIKYYPRLQGSAFHFDHVHIPWNHQVPLHQQETWELSYVITGKGARIIGDHVESFSKGEVIFIPPNIPHCWSFDENVHDDVGKIENITITIEQEFLERCKELFPQVITIFTEIQSNKNAVSFTGAVLGKLQFLMLSMISQNAIKRIATFFEILELLACCSDMKIVGKPLIDVKRERKLQEIYLFVLNNFHSSITLDAISKTVGIPKSTFCVFFKKMTGKSFFTFLTEFRIASSCEMLSKTKLSIAEISIASGFNDIPYFNRVFKKYKNTTPSEYRNSRIV